MAWEGDKGEGWETEREKKYIELICLWEFCLWFIETVRQLKERMLQTQGRVSTRNQERQSETIFQMSNCRGQQNAEFWLYPVSSANWTCMFLRLHVISYNRAYFWSVTVVFLLLAENFLFSFSSYSTPPPSHETGSSFKLQSEMKKRGIIRKGPGREKVACGFKGLLRNSQCGPPPTANALSMNANFIVSALMLYLCRKDLITIQWTNCQTIPAWVICTSDK